MVTHLCSQQQQPPTGVAGCCAAHASLDEPLHSKSCAEYKHAVCSHTANNENKPVAKTALSTRISSKAAQATAHMMQAAPLNLPASTGSRALCLQPLQLAAQRLLLLLTGGAGACGRRRLHLRVVLASWRRGHCNWRPKHAPASSLVRRCVRVCGQSCSAIRHLAAMQAAQQRAGRAPQAAISERQACENTCMRLPQGRRRHATHCLSSSAL